MEVGEYSLNNYMWANVKDHVRDYAIMKQQETMLKYQQISTANRITDGQISSADHEEADSLADDYASAGNAKP